MKVSILRSVVLIMLFSCSNEEKEAKSFQDKYTHEIKTKHLDQRRNKTPYNFHRLNIGQIVRIDHFWQFIDSVRSECGDNLSCQSDYLVESLSKLTKKDIVEFERQLRIVLIESDQYKVMAAAKIMEGYVSDDSYLYFRCWLISLGKDNFYKVMDNADYLAEIIPDNFESLGNEDLLSVSSRALRKIESGKKKNFLSPGDILSDRNLDYNFISNTKGKDWKEEELPGLLPELWKKYH